MICPYCKSEGKTSIVNLGRGGSTLLAFQPYYDEAGAFHSHDPNTHTVRYDCTNGHHFMTKEKRGCGSCDYGRGSQEVVRL